MGALAILLGLGTWQWQRLAWKTALLAHLDEAARGSPKSYDTLDFAKLPTGEDGRYMPVTARGRFEHDREVYVFWSQAGVPGYLVLTPFTPVKGPAILVNRGFVPERLRLPATRLVGQLPGEVTISGLLVRRHGPDSLFTPEPDVARRIWYAVDPAAIASKLGLDVVRTHTLDVTTSVVPGGWPKGRSVAARIATIPNRHLEYALTWWGLAVVLGVIYGIFALPRIRKLGRKAP